MLIRRTGRRGAFESPPRLRATSTRDKAERTDARDDLAKDVAIFDRSFFASGPVRSRGPKMDPRASRRSIEGSARRYLFAFTPNTFSGPR